MASYSPRRGPNVSQYLANLNQIPNFQETPTQESFGLDDDLALFTNVEFLDFEDVAGVDFGQSPESVAKDNSTGSKDVAGNDVKNINFDEGFRFDEITYPPQPPNGLTPLQISQPPSYDVYTSPTSYAAPPLTGDKRTFSQASPETSTSGDLEASSRAAAEEDKRRRNTAASARFRVKKKQREQALEKTAKEMSDKVDVLEGRVAELERENKWLKSLVVDKAVGGKEEVKEMLERFSEENRSSGAAKKGVGTAGKDEGVKAEGK